MENCKFGLEKKKSELNIYKDKFITVNTNNSSYLGKLVRWDDIFGYLCPSIVDDCDPKGGFLKRIEYDMPTSFSLRDMVGIKPTTEKNLENYVEFHNNIEKKIEKLDREEKINKLTKSAS